MKRVRIKLTKKQVKILRKEFGDEIQIANAKGEAPALMAQPFISHDQKFMDVTFYPEIYVKAVRAISNIIHKADGDGIEL